MPKSQQPFEGEKIIIDRILTNPNTDVLDIGAGDGKWGKLLKNRVKSITALEVWEKYIRKYELSLYYNKVVCNDISKVDDSFLEEYDTMIFGDVLEHLRKSKADKIVERLRKTNKKVYLTIPITNCPQDGMVYGNPYETHLYQWDHTQLALAGWELLHKGFNENKTVEIGSYVLKGK
jgi:cyclopropane fatty-acyl-phospholipid synthase-like methyltransferase